MSEDLTTLFPGLRSSAHRITSSAARAYNCIGWAAQDDTKWWWPEGDPPIYWPPSVPREVTLEAFSAAFLLFGYHVSTDAEPSHEPEIEKVALFADAEGTPTHAARQLVSGRWTSKLGESEDIEHELHALEGDLYDKVAVILKRPIDSR